MPLRLLNSERSGTASAGHGAVDHRARFGGQVKKLAAIRPSGHAIRLYALMVAST